jgi:hypothetical protein
MWSIFQIFGTFAKNLAKKFGPCPKFRHFLVLSLVLFMYVYRDDCEILIALATQSLTCQRFALSLGTRCPIRHP